MSRKNYALFIPPDLKDRFRVRCSQNYEDMSVRIRALIREDLKKEKP